MGSEMCIRDRDIEAEEPSPSDIEALAPVTWELVVEESLLVLVVETEVVEPVVVLPEPESAIWKDDSSPRLTSYPSPLRLAGVRAAGSVASSWSLLSDSALEVSVSESLPSLIPSSPSEAAMDDPSPPSELDSAAAELLVVTPPDVSVDELEEAIDDSIVGATVVGAAALGAD